MEAKVVVFGKNTLKMELITEIANITVAWQREQKFKNSWTVKAARTAMLVHMLRRRRNSNLPQCLEILSPPLKLILIIHLHAQDSSQQSVQSVSFITP
jgi:hypothetical protein